MFMLPPIITIDGPSGVGKGSLCRALSKKLNWNVLDSGSIYRALALEALFHDIIVDSIHIKKLVKLALDLDVVFINTEDELSVFLRGENVSRQIYTEFVGNLASKIAVFPEIRAVLLQYQKRFRIFPGLIANGRDMGTVVFPTANLKIFLSASLKVRCERRLRQLKKNGFDVTLDHILKTIKERDFRDYTRKIAPLVPAVDSLVFDSTYFSLDEIVYGVLKCFYNSLFTKYT